MLINHVSVPFYSISFAAVVPQSFEQYLQDSFQEETRLVTLPDDSKISIKAVTYCWKVHDFVLVFGGYDQATLVRMALAMNEQSGRSFKVDFFTIVDSAHRKLTERLGFDLF